MNNKLYTHTRCQEFKLFISFIVLFFLFSPLQAQMQTGLLLGGGGGSLDISSNINRSNKKTVLLTADYKVNASIGYRFRLRPFGSFRGFVDADASVGVKVWKAMHGPLSHDSYSFYTFDNYDIYFVSVGGTFGYLVYKGLSVGAGIEPTCFLYGDAKRKNTIDVPLVGKVAYNFRFVELGVSYKYGLTNVFETKDGRFGKFRDWQVFVWIPF